MLLKTLVGLLPLLFLTDDGGGAAGDGDGEPAGDGGATPTERETPDPTPKNTDAASPPASSINRQIKAFAAEQGISVEQLIDKYRELSEGQKTEFQRLEGERDTFKTKAEEMEARYRTAAASSAVREAAGQAGAISPKAVYALIRDDVQFDDAGEPSNIAELIERAKEDEPQLFRAAGGSGDGGKGNGQGAPRDINAVFRDMARNAS